jgi:membrane protease YdiL (CAAX protease family)
MFPSPFPDFLNLAGWFHLGYFGLLLPLFALRDRRKVLGVGQQPLPNRLRYFQKTAFSLAILSVLSVLVARVQQIDLFSREMPSPWAIAAGLAMYAVTVTYMWPRWRRAVERRARVVHLFMPANATERAWWIAVSILAGVGEEITWRGVQTALLGTLVGNFWLAALVSALAFGMVHIVQGWKSAAVIVGFALGFQLLVWLAGSLYVAMAVHVAYDLTAGHVYGRLGKELGYDVGRYAQGEAG